LPFPIDLAIGLYNSLYYYTGRDDYWRMSVHNAVMIPRLLHFTLMPDSQAQITSGQSNFTKGRITATHGWCNGIQQVAGKLCTFKVQ